jgi:hypothetical protein
MDFFDGIAALAAGEQEEMPLEDLVEVYVRDRVKQVLKL